MIDSRGTPDDAFAVSPAPPTGTAWAVSRFLRSRVRSAIGDQPPNRVPDRAHLVAMLCIATRRFIDEQAVWAVMRFADEPAERVSSRQVTRVAHDDPRGPRSVGQFTARKGEFDQFLADPSDPTFDWNDDGKSA